MWLPSVAGVVLEKPLRRCLRSSGEDRTLFCHRSLPLFADPACEVFVITEFERELPEVAARIHYLRAPVAQALSELREKHGIRSLLAEGGPTLNGGDPEGSPGHLRQHLARVDQVIVHYHETADGLVADRVQDT